MGKARMRIDSRVLQMAEGKKKGVLYIYDTVQNDGYDWWNGEKIVSETSEAFIRDRLAEMGAVEELDIHISSSGGSVKVGLGIYSQIKSFGCPRKVAYIDGMAASIATVIAMAADEVVMQNAGLMMIHDAWIECTSGNAKELRKEADDLDVITSASKTAYLEHSKGKITEEQLTAFMDAESWLTAAQCLEYGLCDRIGEAEEDEEGGGPMQAARIACMMGGVEQAGKIMAEISMLKKRIEALEQSGDDKGASSASEEAEAREKKKRTCSAVMAAMRGMADGIK